LFVGSAYPDQDFAARLEELFVVRDMVAHNHLWQAQFAWDENPGLKLLSAEQLEGYGDDKSRRVLNPTNRRTRLLGINLFPTRICCSDTAIVLKNALDSFLLLEDKDRRYIYISSQHVRIGDALVLFTELVAELWEKYGPQENSEPFVQSSGRMAARFPEATFSDAIPDRFVHNAHRLQITGSRGASRTPLMSPVDGTMLMPTSLRFHRWTTCPDLVVELERRQLCFSSFVVNCCDRGALSGASGKGQQRMSIYHLRGARRVPARPAVFRHFPREITYSPPQVGG
jgi:hypothetical protein